jgi:AAHS family benzoate transporter-like MFS transporter
VLGPIIGGWLAAAGIGGSTAFYICGAVNLLRALVTVLVPVSASRRKPNTRWRR